MHTRPFLTLAIPLACAALFARLGVWQLSRLAERQAFNRTLAGRLAAPPVDGANLPADTAVGHYRLVSARGVLLYDREVAYAGRSRQGSPGVNLLSPLKLVGRDTVVMVNRGWAYSPDASTVDFARWRERDTVSVVGYAETFAAVGARGETRAASGMRQVRALNRAAVERAVGLPLARYLIVQTSDSALRADSVPVRLGAPALDEGPHRSYAIQWFGFATIAVVGGVALFRRSR